MNFGFLRDKENTSGVLKKNKYRGTRSGILTLNSSVVNSKVKYQDFDPVQKEGCTGGKHSFEMPLDTTKSLSYRTEKSQ